MLLETTPRSVYVILGAHQEQMRPELEGLDVEVVLNDQWRVGLSSSLRVARTVCRKLSRSGCLVTSVDQPLLQTAHLQALLAMAKRWPNLDVLSAYGRFKGIPALIRPETLDLATRLVGDHGLRAVLDGRPWRVVRNDDLLEDLDTPEQVEMARIRGWIDETQVMTRIDV